MTDTNLIPLQAAYCRQSIDVKNNRWIVFSAETEKEIAELPYASTPKEAMSYLHFARKFELEAMNIGIQFGKDIHKQESDAKIQRLVAMVEALKVENEGLANNLERHIIEG